MNTALALPTPLSSPAKPAVRRRSLLRVLRHRAGLLCVLTLLGSSASYCVYALASLAH